MWKIDDAGVTALPYDGRVQLVLFFTGLALVVAFGAVVAAHAPWRQHDVLVHGFAAAGIALFATLVSTIFTASLLNTVSQLISKPTLSTVAVPSRVPTGLYLPSTAYSGGLAFLEAVLVTLAVLLVIVAWVRPRRAHAIRTGHAPHDLGLLYAGHRPLPRRHRLHPRLGRRDGGGEHHRDVQADRRVRRRAARHHGADPRRPARLPDAPAGPRTVADREPAALRHAGCLPGHAGHRRVPGLPAFGRDRPVSPEAGRLPLGRGHLLAAREPPARPAVVRRTLHPRGRHPDPPDRRRHGGGGRPGSGAAARGGVRRRPAAALPRSAHRRARRRLQPGLPDRDRRGRPAPAGGPGPDQPAHPRLTGTPALRPHLPGVLRAPASSRPSSSG